MTDLRLRDRLRLAKHTERTTVKIPLHDIVIVHDEFGTPLYGTLTINLHSSIYAPIRVSQPAAPTNRGVVDISLEQIPWEKPRPSPPPTPHDHANDD